MHQPRSSFAILVVLLAGCAGGFGKEDEAAIRQVLADQEKAWDVGDIAGFMKGYTDDVCFVTIRGTTCGKEEVTANYRRRYPDRAAMGDLAFRIGEVLPAGGGYAWCTGEWTLHREADTLGGGFTLLWQRSQDGWRIVRDHTY